MSTKDSEYHSEMNESVFLSWLEKTVLPTIKATAKKFVLFFDRATFHPTLMPETKPMHKNYVKCKLADAISVGAGRFFTGRRLGKEEDQASFI